MAIEYALRCPPGAVVERVQRRALTLADQMRWYDPDIKDLPGVRGRWYIMGLLLNPAEAAGE